jgi:hypothetical protein
LGIVRSIFLFLRKPSPNQSATPDKRFSVNGFARFSATEEAPKFGRLADTRAIKDHPHGTGLPPVFWVWMLACATRILKLANRMALLKIQSSVFLFVLLLIAPAIASAQTQLADDSGPPDSEQQSPPSQTSPPPGTLPDKPSANRSSQAPEAENDKDHKDEGKQTKRMFWLVPNFGAVDANSQLPPLSTREKFKLAAQDSVTDYSSYTWTAVLAGQAMALKSDPEFGNGAAGYGRYYWHNFVDGISGTFFTEAIVPALTHQDPRYYTMGKGGLLRRTRYAIICAFVTKTDSGGTAFNWSEVGGNALEAGLANAYYPAQERGASQTARNFGTQMESAVLNHIFQEFWPDIRTKILRRK